MTSTDTGVRTGTELLYLSVDLGKRPGLNTFANNVEALRSLSNYAASLVQVSASARLVREFGSIPEQQNEEPSQVTGFRVVRTSMASPWDTVLAALADRSSPVAYGMAGLYALHRMLRLVMAWQNHRLDARAKEMKLTEQQADLIRRVSETIRDVRTNAGLIDVDAMTPDSQSAHDRRVSHAVNVLNQASNGLGTVRAAELISPDDPRVGGS